jgi:hypothetical protein
MITNLYQRNTSGVFKTIKRKYNQLNLRTHDMYFINVKYFDTNVITAIREAYMELRDNALKNMYHQFLKKYNIKCDSSFSLYLVYHVYMENTYHLFVLEYEYFIISDSSMI